MQWFGISGARVHLAGGIFSLNTMPSVKPCVMFAGESLGTVFPSVIDYGYQRAFRGRAAFGAVGRDHSGCLSRPASTAHSNRQIMVVHRARAITHIRGDGRQCCELRGDDETKILRLVPYDDHSRK